MKKRLLSILLVLLMALTLLPLGGIGRRKQQMRRKPDMEFG